MDDTKAMYRENGRFLGEYFLVQIPLESQTYKKPDECLSRWVMVLPPEDTGDDAINKARENMGPTIDRWVKKEVLPFNNMTEFMYWLNRPGARNKKDPPTTLVTLSHHSRNSLYFYRKDSAKDNPLRSSMINRKFEQPSVAILNGCGAGSEGAVQLIRRFNRYGFSTFIAPSTEIEGLMAGTFLKLFADEISESDPKKAETIGLVYWRTLQQLSKTKPPNTYGSRTFGAKVYQFAFLGNNDVPICEPTIENRPSVDD
jgi:hypothetical protein